MTRITYEIVEHDGGWAYKVGRVFSETYSSHEQARRAAERAAAEQRLGGRTEGIEYQDREGRWHREIAQGGDRPSTQVKD